MSRNPNPCLYFDYSTDAMLAMQYVWAFLQANQYNVRGEIKLMAGIVEEALDCFQKYCLSGGRRQQRLHREAEQWFFSDDHHWPFSFINICLMLEWDPEYIRGGLKAWKERQLQQRKGRGDNKHAA